MSPQARGGGNNVRAHGLKDAAGKRCDPTHNTRMKHLRKWLDHSLKPEQSPEASGSFIDVAYLYYDGHCDTDAAVQSLQRMEAVVT